MNITRYQPSFIRPFESLFDDGIFGRTNWLAKDRFPSANMTPLVDIEESDDKYVVDAEMPGLSKDDINVSVDNGVLTISASCEDEREEEKEGQYLRRERYVGSYLRCLSLGNDIDDAGIVANFKDGVLKLEIPKVKAKTPEAAKKIVVK